MARLIGFNTTEGNSVRAAMSDTKRALKMALDEAFNENDQFLGRIDKYFGKGEGGQDATTHLVMKTINSMKVALDSDIYVVERGGDQPGTNAEAQNFQQRKITFGGTLKRIVRTARLRGTVTYEGRTVNALEAAMLYANRHGSLKMTLYDLYFDMPYKLKKSQSQVETFMHELSHTAAGTHDVDAPKCYGNNGVLYCRSIGKGPMNAENYGMFLQSYLI